MTNTPPVEAAPAQRTAETDERTIIDFGDQWTAYQDNSGYYGSVALLADIFGPLLTPAEIAGMLVAEIGSGTGRIVNMLLDAGAAHVTAVEPSRAFDVLARNTAARSGQVRLVRGRGEALPVDVPLDLVVSIGVLHHITDPAPIIRKARQALKPGGRLLIWLYGHEGNEAYLAVTWPLRAITTRLPHTLLVGLCYPLDWLASLHIGLSRVLPMPMRDYMINVFSRLAHDKRRLVIYDQLNPAYAKYYTEAEARALLENNGFTNVRLHHRHGYSWTVIGERPA